MYITENINYKKGGSFAAFKIHSGRTERSYTQTYTYTNIRTHNWPFLGPFANLRKTTTILGSPGLFVRMKKLCFGLTGFHEI